MQQRLRLLTPAQVIGEAREALDTRILSIKRSVDKLEQRAAAKDLETRRIGPDDPAASRVPQPGGIGRYAQVFQIWPRGGRHTLLTI